MTDSNKGSDIFDIVDRAVSFYEKNKDTIRGATGMGDSIELDDDDPLKQASVTDEEVMITVDVGVEDLENIRLALNGTTAEIVVGGQTVTANVPSDVDMDSPEANLNNGVLEVRIPRVGGN